MSSRGWLLLLVFGATSCVHTVTVYSDPAGARISVDGESVGTAPTIFTERSGYHKKRVIGAELAGFSSWSEEHEQNQPSPLLVPSVVGAYFLLVPIVGVLWGYQLEDDITIRLDPESKQSSSNHEGPRS